MADKIDILGFQIDNVSMNEAVAVIENFIQEKNPHQVITANSLMLLKASKEPKLREVFSHAGLVVADSSGVVLAGKILGRFFKERLAGIDLLYKLVERCEQKKYSIFLFGAQPTVARRAAENLKKRHPQLSIAGTVCGYFQKDEEKKIVQAIVEARPDILFVGLSIPRQELWIAENLSRLSVPVCIGVGGSFDVISGRVRRAPWLMQYLGLEWFWRMLIEPWRIKRIVFLPLFIWQVWRFKRSRRTRNI